MEILLIRHGETTADVEVRHEGNADFPLTDAGRGQAEQVRSWIATWYQPDMIFSSPLIRAAATARIIADRLSLPVSVDPELREISCGVYAGLTYQEADARYPWPPGGFKPHEASDRGESQIAFRCRLEAFWSRLREQVPQKPNQRVLIVAHGGTIRMLYQAALGLPTVSNVWVRTDHGGAHLWHCEIDVLTVLFANRMPPPDATTEG